MNKWDRYLSEDVEPETEAQEDNLVEDESISAVNLQEENQTQKDPTDWSKYLDEGEEGWGEWGVRQATRTLSRVGESLAAIPGDTVEMIKAIDEWLPEEPSWLKRDQTFVQKGGKKLLEKLPTTEDLKSFTSWLSDGYTDPKNAAEEFGDDAVQLAAVLSIGTKDPTKFKNVAKQLFKSVVAKGAGKGAETLGGGPGTQAAVELGTLFLTSLISRKMPKQFVSEQYESAMKRIPEGTMVITDGLSSNLAKEKMILEKGLPRASNSKTVALNTINEIENKIAGGAIPFDEVVAMYHDVNEVKTNKNLWADLDKSGKKLLKRRLDGVSKAIGNFIDEKGEGIPGFLEEWRGANASFATLKQSEKVSDYINGQIGGMPKHLAGSLAVELAIGHPVAAGVTIGGASLVKSGELMYRVMNDPGLRKHYINVMKAAADESKAGLYKELTLFDRELKKKGITKEKED
jgi:hypothetical protein